MHHDRKCCILHFSSLIRKTIDNFAKEKSTLEIASELHLQCFMLIQRYPVHRCDRDAMEAAIRVCNLCDCLGSLNLPPDTCDSLRTARTACAGGR